MVKMLLFSLLLVAAVVSESLACSCGGTPTFCDGDFAAVIEIQDTGTVVDFTRTYKIKLMDIVYHDTPLSNGQLKKPDLSTASIGALCGVQLSKGSFYAITGGLSISSGPPAKAKLSTGLCTKLELIATKKQAKSFEFPACPIVVEDTGIITVPPEP